jgi:ATP-dependent protease HslVU (ClpYQ) peptidase subunit
MTTIVTTSGNNFATLASDRGITSDLVMHDMSKIVQQGKWLIGVAGDVRACDLLQYGVKYPVVPKHLHNKAKQDWFGWVVLNVVPLIRTALKAEQDQDFEAILVTYGRAFIITSDYGVLDAYPYWSIGSGSKLAIGHIASYQYTDSWNKNHDLVAKQSIEVAGMHDPNTRGTIDVYVSDKTGLARKA